MFDLPIPVRAVYPYLRLRLRVIYLYPHTQTVYILKSLLLIPCYPQVDRSDITIHLIWPAGAGSIFIKFHVILQSQLSKCKDANRTSVHMEEKKNQLR